MYKASFPRTLPQTSYSSSTRATKYPNTANNELIRSIDTFSAQKTARDNSQYSKTAYTSR